jgi:hypothetical protein
LVRWKIVNLDDPRSIASRTGDFSYRLKIIDGPVFQGETTEVQPFTVGGRACPSNTGPIDGECNPDDESKTDYDDNQDHIRRHDHTPL